MASSDSAAAAAAAAEELLRLSSTDSIYGRLQVARYSELKRVSILTLDLPKIWSLEGYQSSDVYWVNFELLNKIVDNPYQK